MALVRQILLKTEQNTEVSGWIDIDIEGYAPEEISYHIKLLADAELIEAQDLTTTEEFEWKPKNLTWKGHEFLDAARNETT